MANQGESGEGMMANERLRQWMGRGVVEKTDAARGLSIRLLRNVDGGVLTIGVVAESEVDHHVHALLDLLAWHHYEIAARTKPANHVRIGLARGNKTELALPALRTLQRNHTGSPHIEIHVESRDDAEPQFILDEGDPPTFDGADPTRYAKYLEAWYKREPTGLAQELLRRSPDAERLRLYPQLSQAASGQWSLRLDGLQVGLVGESSGTLQVGGTESSSQIAAKTWRMLGGDLAVTPDTLDDAVNRIHQLALSLGDEPGELLDHGLPEHALESAVVRGDIAVSIGGRPLAPIGADPSRIAHGSQIPTLWSPDGTVRYLDALMRDGQVPWAIEMKVKAGGGYGAYLRHAVGQAVLYRHFLRSAPAYVPWFAHHSLDPQALRAAVLYPRPTADVQRKIAGRIGNLWLIAAAFDVQVVTVDAGRLQ